MSSPAGRPATSAAPRQPPGSSGWTSVPPAKQKGQGTTGAGRPTSGGERVKVEATSPREGHRSSSGKYNPPISTAPLKSAGGPSTSHPPPSAGTALPPGLPPAIAALHAPGGPFDPATNPAPTSQPGPSEFIKKLYKMLEEEAAIYGNGEPGKPRPKDAKRGSVGWGRGGTTFVVWDMNDFTTKIL